MTFESQLAQAKLSVQKHIENKPVNNLLTFANTGKAANIVDLKATGNWTVTLNLKNNDVYRILTATGQALTVDVTTKIKIINDTADLGPNLCKDFIIKVDNIATGATYNSIVNLVKNDGTTLLSGLNILTVSPLKSTIYQLRVCTDSNWIATVELLSSVSNI